MLNRTGGFFQLHMSWMKNKYTSESKGQLGNTSVLESWNFFCKLLWLHSLQKQCLELIKVSAKEEAFCFQTHEGKQTCILEFSLPFLCVVVLWVTWAFPIPPSASSNLLSQSQFRIRRMILVATRGGQQRREIELVLWFLYFFLNGDTFHCSALQRSTNSASSEQPLLFRALPSVHSGGQGYLSKDILKAGIATQLLLI